MQKSKLKTFTVQKRRNMITNPFEGPKKTYGGAWIQASGHDSHTRSQYRSRHHRAKGAQGAQTAFFQWDSQNRIGGDISKKRLNMLKNPLEVPKRTLWWGLNSSLRSRVAHTEPISVTAPPGQGAQGGPNGIFSMGLAKSKIWR